MCDFKEKALHTVHRVHIQLKPEVYINCIKRQSFFSSMSDMKSDKTFPVLGQLGLPKLFLFAKCQNNERDNYLDIFLLLS